MLGGGLSPVLLELMQETSEHLNTGCEVIETPEDVTYKIDVPGCHGGDINLEIFKGDPEGTIKEDHLCIAWERRNIDKEGVEIQFSSVNYQRQERHLGLPPDYDENRVVAEIRAGVLFVKVGRNPKKALERPQPRKIPITTHD
jgi:HSP20 family molecular chaperone IbpA